MDSRTGFFSLPPELRNHIYELVITHSGINQPGITRTCQETRNESLKLFYSTHCFPFDIATGNAIRNYVTSMRKWLRAIGPVHASLIRTMRFRVVGYRWMKEPAGAADHQEDVSPQIEARIFEDGKGGWTVSARWIAANGDDAGPAEVGRWVSSAKRDKGRGDAGLLEPDPPFLSAEYVRLRAEEAGTGDDVAWVVWKDIMWGLLVACIDAEWAGDIRRRPRAEAGA